MENKTEKVSESKTESVATSPSVIMPEPSVIKKPKTKNEERSGKLWTHETRMFLEKFFYLNKSTTKYAITGVDAVTFETSMRICDRATGCNITVGASQFTNFIHNIECLLLETYTEQNKSYCGHSFTKIMNGVWKITSLQSYGSLVIQTVSLENLIRGKNIILQEMMACDGRVVSDYINLLRTKSFDVKTSAMLHFLEEERKLESWGSTRHQIICDLIIKNQSFMTLAEYDEGFMRRLSDEDAEAESLSREINNVFFA